MLRKNDDGVLSVALALEMSGKRERGRPKKQVEEETAKIGLKKEGALNRENKEMECEQ